MTLRRVLVELTVTEQRYRAVLEVQAGSSVTDVAGRCTWSALDEHGDSVNPLTVEYLNRLSDLLFILSRVASTDSHGGTGDILRVPGGSTASATSRR